MNRMRRLASLILLVAGLFAVAVPAAMSAPGAAVPAPSAAVPLAPHRASYKLTLDNSRSGDIVSGSGTMSYEVMDACDGWAVRQRLQMLLTNRDGQAIKMISDYTTWESKDGLKLRFRMRQTTEEAVTSEVAGEASLERPGGPGTATYTLPEAGIKPLPAGTLFPTAHTEAILAAARAGKKFVAVPLFDGTNATGAQDSTIVIAPWGSETTTQFAPLQNMPSGRFRIAFFDRDSKDPNSDYEVAMRYWDNGVADDLSMDFGDFVMAGKLATFTPLKPGC
jgi:hypothetical protein